MAYIGKTPIVGNFVKLDAITTSATTTFNLLNGGVSYYPQSANNCIVSLNGVIQSPTSAYTISGSTIVFSDALTSSDTIDFILVLGDVLSIGTPSDGTITPSKLSTGVAGLVTWQSVQTSGFTAVAGRGYPCNTTSAAFTVTLPASANAGDTIRILDYAGTFATNNLTINPNSLKIQSQTSNVIVSKNNEALTLTYIDSTSGWLITSGANEGTSAISIPYSVEYLVVAGGGGGGNDVGGGGGAGGLLSNTFSAIPGTSYTITIGAGGAGSSSGAPSTGTAGSNSSISGTGLTTITANGGGGGGSYPAAAGVSGGSGGGGGGGGVSSPTASGGTGTSGQGNSGGNGISNSSAGAGGGGGGAGAAGTAASGTTTAGNGGNGSSAYSAWGSATSTGQNSGGTYYYAGGGAGCNDPGTAGTAGLGGGGYHTSGTSTYNGTANTGGGAGGGGIAPTNNGGTGGSGIIILRYSGSQKGTGGTVVSSGGYTYHTFTSTSSYTG
ncbi:hypothetical protein EB001_18600 [bacterium]|nr:hypothetical protein [bacterium]